MRQRAGSVVDANRRMRCRTRRVVFGALVAGMALSMTPAHAQLDPGNKTIKQRGVVVGEIFVPERTSQRSYVEHWVLFPEYVYPADATTFVTEIVVERDGPATEEEFFREVHFPPGSRYVRVLAHDTDRLPVRGVAATPSDHRSSGGSLTGMASLAGGTWGLVVGVASVAVSLVMLGRRRS